jgi:pilus assembly protein Flp/PilA
VTTRRRPGAEAAALPLAANLKNRLQQRRSTTNMIKNFLRDETGLELSEYAVAAALVALAVITAFTTLGTNIGTKITNLATKIGS